MQSNSVRRQASSGETELALLAGIRSRSAHMRNPRLQLGIGDDCALLRLRRGEEMAVTTDLSIEGHHFRLESYPPEAIGHRTLARGLSDLAAMGARPIAAFLSLGLPRALVKKVKVREPAWLDRFLDGFLSLAEAHQTPLAGGDLAESPIATADIVLAGAVQRGRALLRSGARPGDLLYVTGNLGGSAAGLALLAHSVTARQRRYFQSNHWRLRIPDGPLAALRQHFFPQPRIAQGLRLAGRWSATAAIDLSDGLSTDLAHLCEESRVAAEVNAASLPIHPAATLLQALHGGEDYELLFTAPSSARLPRSIAGVAVTPIGRIRPRGSGKPPVRLITARGKLPLEPQGWQHFC